MRITDVRAHVTLVGTRPQCLVKVETDAGIYGWGESGLSARERAVYVPMPRGTPVQVGLRHCAVADGFREDTLRQHW